MTKSKLFLSLLLAGTVASAANAQSLKDAQAAIDAEQYDKAKGILQNLVEKKAKDGQNYFYLGQIYLINEKLDSAEIVFKNGLTNAPKEPLNTVGLGILDLQRGNADAAEQKFASVTSGLKKKDYLPLLYIGQAYNNAPKPDYTKAIDYLTQAQAKNQKDADVSMALGDAYIGFGDNSQAYRAYDGAVDLDPSSVRAKIQKTVIIRRAHAFDEAITQLNDIAAEYPTYGPVYRELAETQLQFAKRLPDNTDEEKVVYETEIAKAVDSYKKYLEVTGDNSPEARVRYADFLVWGQKYDELKSVALSLENVPGVDAKVYRYLGLISVNQDQDYTKGVQYFDKLFAEADTARLIDIDYLFAGLANVYTGNGTKGVELFEKALAKNPELIGELGASGIQAYSEGNYDAAAAIFTIPAKQKGTEWYGQANFFLGNAKFRSGSTKKEAGEDGTQDFQDAISILGLIIESDDQKLRDEYLVEALYLVAYANLSLDTIDPEQPELTKGLFVTPFEKLVEVLKAKESLDDAEKGRLVDAYNKLGYYYILKADYAKATKLYEDALTVSPEDEEAKTFLDYLKG